MKKAGASKAKAFRPLERDIQRSILDYLKAKKIFHFRVNTGGVVREGRWTPSPNTTKGVADIIAIKTYAGFQQGPDQDGKWWPWHRFVAIEVKRPKEKATLEQNIFLQQVQKAGGVGIVAYNLDDVRRIFE